MRKLLSDRIVKFGYACFLGSGLVRVLWLLLDLISAYDPDVAEGLLMMGFFLFLPLYYIAYLTDILGTVAACFRWRELPLVVMALVSAVVILRKWLWPGFCTDTWTEGLCLQITDYGSGLLFVSFSLWHFCFRKYFSRRLLFLWLAALSIWILVIIYFRYDDILDVFRELLALTGKKQPFLSFEESAIVNDALNRLRSFGRAIVIPVLLLLTVAGVVTLIKRRHNSTT